MLPPASALVGILPSLETTSALPGGLIASACSFALRKATIPAAIAGPVKGEAFARLKLIVVLLGIGGLTTGGAILAPRLIAVVHVDPNPLPQVEPEKPLAAKVEIPASVVLEKTARIHGPNRPYAAVARPVSGITIDGDLNDWPVGMERHTISTDLMPEGAVYHKNYAVSDGENAYFTVGCNPTDQRLYLAVVVEDDQSVAGFEDVLHTDALEIFVDGSEPTARSR